jgi:hypothetical protein
MMTEEYSKLTLYAFDNLTNMVTFISLLLFIVNLYAEIAPLAHLDPLL